MAQRRTLLAAGGAACLASACGVLPSGSAAPAGGEGTPGTTPGNPSAAASGYVPGLDPALWPPAAARGFRGAWVATVANIEWPSRPGLPVATQQAEARTLIERARETGLNALILQVRPAADALYASTLEPWSEVLSGTQGRASEPGWDPLAFWISEAHRRGIELHAWFNPYRARHSSARSPAAANHVSRTRPEIVRPYGEQLWMDPGEDAAAAHTLAVIADVVRRYDIDGVHIDDYFYPYPENRDGIDQPFPDDAPWVRYLQSGSTLARDDWRRQNVDHLVRDLYRTVHAIKPQVRVGISPFGIGKPALRPAGITGFSQYDKLYADVERWCSEGWFDYLVPQLYWPIDRTAQAFAPLLDYWLAQNPKGRHVWPGLYSSRVGADSQPWPAAEIVNQVALTRARFARGGDDGVAAARSGHVHISLIALARVPDGLTQRLQRGAYSSAALAPATPWLHRGAPTPPLLRREGSRVHITAARGGEPVFVWAVWLGRGTAWRLGVRPAHDGVIEIDAAATERIVVSAVGRTGIESERRLLSLV